MTGRLLRHTPTYFPFTNEQITVYSSLVYGVAQAHTTSGHSSTTYPLFLNKWDSVRMYRGVLDLIYCYVVFEVPR